MNTQSTTDHRARLCASHEVVGYCWISNQGVLFSSDEQAWSSEIIPHQFQERSIGWTDRNGTPLFWGDVVRGRDGPSRQSKYYGFFGPLDAPSVIADLKTGELWDLNSALAQSLKGSVEWVDRVGAWSINDQIRSQLTRLVSASTPLPTWALIGALVSICLGSALSACVQHVFAHTMGPVWATLGGMFGLCMYWWVSQRKTAWLSRAHLIRLSWQMGLTLCVTSLVGGLWLLDHEISVRVVVAYLLFGGLFGVTLTTISGDLVAWARGGYASELPKGKWNRRYPHR